MGINDIIGKSKGLVKAKNDKIDEAYNINETNLNKMSEATKNFRSFADDIHLNGKNDNKELVSAIKEVKHAVLKSKPTINVTEKMDVLTKGAL
jgi:hypothetical protein